MSLRIDAPLTAAVGDWTFDVVTTSVLGKVTALLTLEQPSDSTPPNTVLTTGPPKYTDPSGNVFVASDTSFRLTAEDDAGGTGVASTYCRICNTTSYHTGLITATPRAR